MTEIEGQPVVVSALSAARRGDLRTGCRAALCKECVLLWERPKTQGRVVVMPERAARRERPSKTFSKKGWKRRSRLTRLTSSVGMIRPI
jgi:hypothetical protein